METRANYVAIGAFVILVLFGAFASLYWLYRSSEPGATEVVRIIFPEPVTGLSNGGSVLFNGIRVGEVTRLEFAPEGGDNVIAITRLNPRAPIKTDTVATLGFQGLTGVAYISLSGGSESAPSLFAREEVVDEDEDGIPDPPTIEAATSTFTNVVDTATSVLQRLNSTLDTVDQLLTDNRDNVNTVVANVKTFTDALAESAPQISGLIDDVSNAGRAIATTVPQVTSVVQSANTILTAINPERVGQIVDNVETFTSTLPQISQQAEQIVGNVNGLVVRLDDAAGVLGEAIRSAGDVIASVDSASIGEIVENIRNATGVLSTRSAEIGTFVDNAAVVSGNVRELTETLAGKREALGKAVDDAGALIGDAREAVSAARPAIDSFSQALAAVTPEQVTRIVGNVDRITSKLAEETESFSTLVHAATDAAQSIEQVARAIAERNTVIEKALDDAGVLIANLREASNSAPQLVTEANNLLTDARGVVQAVDAAAINKVVTDIGTFATSLSAQSGNIESLVTGATGAAEQIQSIASAISEKMPQISSVIDNAEAVSASIRTASAGLPELVESLRPGIENVSTALGSIDPEMIANIVQNANSFVEQITAQGEPIAGIVADARVIAADGRTLVAAISSRSEEIGTMVDNASRVVTDVQAATARLGGVIDALEPGLRNAGDALSAIDPAMISSIVQNANSFVEQITAQGEPIAGIVADARVIAADGRTLVAAISSRSEEIGTMVDNASRVVTDVQAATGKLSGAIDALEPGIRNAGDALSALDPEAIGAIQRDVASFITAISEKQGTITAMIDSANGAASRIEEVATAISTRTPQIGEVIDRIDAISLSAQNFASTLPGLVETLQPGIENVSQVLQSIDREAIQGVVTDLQSLATSLRQQGPAITRIVASVEATTTDAQAIATNVRGVVDTIAARQEAIGTTIDNVNATVASARTFADGLPNLLQRVEPGVANFSDALGAIDPTAVSTIVTNVRDVTTTLSGAREDFTQILATAGDAARKVDEVTTAVSARAGAIGNAIDSVTAFATELGNAAPRVSDIMNGVDQAVQSVSETLSEVNTEAINDIIADVRSIASAIAARTGEIGQAIDNISQAARGLNDALGTMGGEDGTLKQIVDRVQRIAENLEEASEEVGSVMTRANRLLDGPIQGLIANVSNAARSVNEVAAAFASRADQIAGSVARFSNGGLDDLRALLNQGRSTLVSIESAVSSFDRDPSRVIFGGPSGPRYQPQRR
ncbi:MlaD family protein [Acuticoccus kandeliae]|uniref:MlaD family protein n=1 Tax=Acuticoccus kandeliae TaxID=2073160 RepID=UPI000D3E5B8C|nr:MlaD family protein [Acuticoccus kandeliae]